MGTRIAATMLVAGMLLAGCGGGDARGGDARGGGPSGDGPLCAGSSSFVEPVGASFAGQTLTVSYPSDGGVEVTLPDGQVVVDDPFCFALNPTERAHVPCYEQVDGSTWRTACP